MDTTQWEWIWILTQNVWAARFPRNKSQIEKLPLTEWSISICTPAPEHDIGPSVNPFFA